MNNNQMQREGLARENKGRGLFYIVIAVATFIIMAVGATFAYFTATTNSADSAVTTGSTTLRLKYISYQSGWMKDDLIPAKSTVVEYSFENQSDITIRDTELMNNGLCKDDFGNSICSIYVFQVKNEANSPQNVSIDVVSEENQFSNLYAMAYELTLPEDLTAYESTENNNGFTDPYFQKTIDDATSGAIKVLDGDNNLLDLATDSDAADKKNVYSPIYVNRNGVVKTLLKYVSSTDPVVMKPAIDRKIVTTILPDGSGVSFENPEDSTEERTANIAGDVEIDGGTVKTFALVLYILDNDQDQTASDAAKKFSGHVVISSGDGSSGVSGSISFVTDDTIKNLQSQQQSTEEEEEDLSGEEEEEEVTP